MNVSINDYTVDVIVYEEGNPVNVIIVEGTSAPSGTMVYKGNLDISGGSLATSALQGWVYRASTDGNISGVDIYKGALLIALQDNPGNTISNWSIQSA